MPVTRIRYVALWLAVAAFTLAYADRVVLLGTTTFIRTELNMNLGATALAFTAFRFGYALFQIPGGWLGDRIGPRRALALVVLWWSVFASATAFAWNATSLTVFRFLFGVGQAATFPIATRSLSHWLLPTERGLAQGLTHAGVWLGAAFVPAVTRLFVETTSWRVAVLFFGLFGLAWVLVWFSWYRDTPAEHSWINDSERNLIQRSLETSRVTTKAVPWRLILSSRTIWTLSAMYACYGWVLATYQHWLPIYLKHRRDLDLGTMGWYAATPIAALISGTLAGGWLSDRVGQGTGSLRLARQSIAVAGFLLAAVGITLATVLSDVSTLGMVLLLGSFGIGMTVSVSWAVPLDIGRNYAGTIAGVMNTAGNLGGALAISVSNYVALAIGWDYVLVSAAILSVTGSVLFTRIDASRPLESSGKPDRRQTIEDIFHDALERPKAERRAFIEKSCAGDPDLIRELESLLWHHDQGTTRFERAIGPMASNLLAATRAANELSHGAMLGPYRIDYKLGEGGMGAVYAATDTRLDRRVAVKVVDRMLASTPRAREHFLREARSGASLAHANVAVLHDVGETDEMPWIVMEYVAGMPLRSWLHSGPFADAECLRYSVQLAAALEHAHTRRIIHRDIKPENIIITEDGTLKVIDFGVAVPLRDETETFGIANPGGFVGTIAYAAPELVSGGEPSSRSDVYSAGLVMYEMVYGRHPLAGLSGPSLVAAITTGIPSAVNGRNTALSAVIERCLSREPTGRYHDGAALAAALRAIAPGGVDRNDEAAFQARAGGLMSG